MMKIDYPKLYFHIVPPNNLLWHYTNSAIMTLTIYVIDLFRYLDKNILETLNSESLFLFTFPKPSLSITKDSRGNK